MKPKKLSHMMNAAQPTLALYTPIRAIRSCEAVGVCEFLLALRCARTGCGVINLFFVNKAAASSCSTYQLTGLAPLFSNPASDPCPVETWLTHALPSENCSEKGLETNGKSVDTSQLPPSLYPPHTERTLPRPVCCYGGPSRRNAG